ncbi:MAG TPA: sugar phosphate isomerase/epimerase [Solirubrobacteraceae bacterium]|jgi:sugar phosphate isomerase/epimerase|nr:sugar phosphate isomerase/epimerase [Solirubrobacteraceae bacterium]
MLTALPLALLTDPLAHMPFRDVLEWCEARGLAGIEVGVGGYSPAPHLAGRELLASADARRALLQSVSDANLEIVALNASGNPLHPAPVIAAAHAQALRDAVRLAGELGVTRVVAMSGCPGGPGANGRGGWPVFAGGAWLPDMEGLWAPQFEQSIAPFWREISEWAAQTAPDVLICLELHPGTSIYNAESFARLREVTGENIAVNLDPSHFWWQGIDPIATIERLDGAIGFVHGKDTLLHPDRIALHGVLDFRWPSDAETMPWHFCSVGGGRPLSEWAALLRALTDHGYRGAISIEHEDPNLGPEDGIEASIRGLRAASEANVAVVDEIDQLATGSPAPFTSQQRSV